jgi:hypothetical protein
LQHREVVGLQGARQSSMKLHFPVAGKVVPSMKIDAGSPGIALELGKGRFP